MAIEFILRSAAAPEAVLDAVRSTTAEPREAIHAHDLLVRRMLGVAGEIKPPAFRLQAVVSRGRYDRKFVELKGTVEAADDGGTRISVWCGWSTTRWYGVASLVLGGLVFLLLGYDTGFFALAFAAVLGAIEYFRGEGLTRSDQTAAYLIGRLERAIAAADGSVASSSRRDRDS